MASVTLTGNLAQVAGGVRQVDIEATDIRQLLRGLAERFPGLGPHLEEGIAVAVDGVIFQDTWVEPISPDAEVHIMPAIGGG